MKGCFEYLFFAPSYTLEDSYNQITGFECPRHNILLSHGKYLSREQSCIVDCWELFSPSSNGEIKEKN